MQQAGIKQHLHHEGYAADPIEVEHQVLTEGLQVGDERRAIADALEIIQVEFESGLVRDRGHVQDRVRGPSEGHDQRDGVLNRARRDDVARGDALTDHLDHGFAGLARKHLTASIDRRR